MSGFNWNAAAGAVLATALGIMGLRELAHVTFETEALKSGGFIIEPAEEAPAAGAAAEAPKLKPDWGTLFTEAALPGLIAEGDKVHKVCMSCHNVEKGGPNQTGPALWGVMGRTAGTHAGFSYTDAMQGYAKPWGLDNMYDYLENPKAYVPGTSMSFAGLKKQEDRVAIVAYLRSLSDSPIPIPAPDPTRDPAAVAAAAAAAAPAPAEGAAPSDGAAAPAEGAAAAPAAAPAEGAAAPAPTAG
jgi:cytochrome c